MCVSEGGSVYVSEGGSVCVLMRGGGGSVCGIPHNHAFNSEASHTTMHSEHSPPFLARTCVVLQWCAG